MRWEMMGFSASEIASTAFSNPKMFRARGETTLALPPLGLRLNGSASAISAKADLMSDIYISIM
jgi:hypothetical protein